MPIVYRPQIKKVYNKSEKIQTDYMQLTYIVHDAHIIWSWMNMDRRYSHAIDCFGSTMAVRICSHRQVLVTCLNEQFVCGCCGWFLDLDNVSQLKVIRVYELESIFTCISCKKELQAVKKVSTTSRTSSSAPLCKGWKRSSLDPWWAWCWHCISEMTTGACLDTCRQLTNGIFTN